MSNPVSRTQLSFPEDEVAPFDFLATASYYPFPPGPQVVHDHWLQAVVVRSTTTMPELAELIFTLMLPQRKNNHKTCCATTQFDQIGVT